MGVSLTKTNQKWGYLQCFEARPMAHIWRGDSAFFSSASSEAPATLRRFSSRSKPDGPTRTSPWKHCQKRRTFFWNYGKITHWNPRKNDMGRPAKMGIWSGKNTVSEKKECPSPCLIIPNLHWKIMTLHLYRGFDGKIIELWSCFRARWSCWCDSLGEFFSQPPVGHSHGHSIDWRNKLQKNQTNVEQTWNKRGTNICYVQMIFL